MQSFHPLSQASDDASATADASSSRNPIHTFHPSSSSSQAHAAPEDSQDDLIFEESLHRRDATTRPARLDAETNAHNALGANGNGFRSDNPFLSPGRGNRGTRGAAKSLGPDDEWHQQTEAESGEEEEDLDFEGNVDADGWGRAGGRKRRKKSPIEKLQDDWVAQRGSPEVLRWSGETVDSVCAMIEGQEAILESLSADTSTSEEEHIRLGIVALDIERARWLLRAYLRCRIAKIEHLSAYLVQKTSGSAYALSQLSPLEQNYAQTFHQLRSSHFQTTVLDALPVHMRGLDDTGAGTGAGMVDVPDVDAPVFVRCLQDCGTLRILDDESTSMSKGSIHLFRWRAVRHLILTGKVRVL